MRRFLTLILVVLFAFPASAETTDTEHSADWLLEKLLPQDQGLVGDWQPKISKFLDGLEQNPPQFAYLDDIDQFRPLISAEHLDFNIAELEGNWRVRSLQATELGTIAYQYFPARIFSEAQAMVFTKNSGSQRHQGMMAQLNDSTVLFVGSLYYGYEEPRLYSTMMAGEVSDQQREFDAVAEIYKIGDDHFLMAFAPRGDIYRFYEIIK